MGAAGEGEAPLQPQDPAQRRRAVPEGDGAAAEQLAFADVELAAKTVDAPAGVVGQSRGDVLDEGVDVVALGDPPANVTLQYGNSAFRRRNVRELTQLLDQPTAVGAEEVIDHDPLVADLVHGGADNRRGVARTEPDPDRFRSVERAERPALHLGTAHLHGAVGQPHDVDTGIGDEVVRLVGADHPGQREPLGEVVGHGNRAEPGAPLVACVRHDTVLQKRPAGPHLREGGRSSARRPRAPVVTSPPATQGIRRAPIRADVREESGRWTPDTSRRNHVSVRWESSRDTPSTDVTCTTSP